MIGGNASRGGLSVLALAVALTATASPAQARQTLFDVLFGGNRPVERQVEQAPATVQAPQRPRAPAPRISSPTYYDYRPQALEKVDFASLAAKITGEGQEESAGVPTRFMKGMAGITDFELLAEKKIAAALIDYYAQNPDFIWVDESGPNKRAEAVLEVLGDASSLGLTDTDYVVNLPLTGASSANFDERLKALARFEMTLSARALRYARDAHLGRVDPNKLSGYHDFPAKPLEDIAVLEVLAGTPTPALYLETLHPQNELYAKLREELKALRASPEQGIVVDPETFVRPGETHREFPKILRIIERDADAAFRAEHSATLEAHAGSEEYKQELVPVIKAAQRLHGLNPDGVIGPRTVGALAGDSKAARIEKVLLAMERLRWHPSYLGNTRVMINAAAFSASYIEDGTEKLTMRTVVGSRSNQTYFFHDEIKFVEFNPYWGVPRSILVNEKLPRLRRDPSYLDRTGYEVTDAKGRRISSSAIDWNAYGSNIPFNVRQRPGPSNALGELKIMFPNKHDIYMHDTPEKHLFKRDTRAFSHGCVRLEQPHAMAAAVLGLSEDEVRGKVAAGRNARQNLDRKIPVYVGYFTAWPESDGVAYHGDVYGRDANLKKALAKVEELRAPGS